ncbi:MAG: tetratricopeptide repeat protein, partial [Rudaea sp.]
MSEPPAASEHAATTESLAELKTAADAALRAYQYANAVELYSRALEAHNQQQTGTRRSSDATLRCDLFSGRAEAYRLSGQLNLEKQDLEEILQLSRAVRDIRREGDALVRLVNATGRLGQYDVSREQADCAVELGRRTGDRKVEADGLAACGILLRVTAEYQAARDYLERAAAIHRELDDRAGLALDLKELGNTFGSTGRGEEAKSYLNQALALYREIGDLYGQASALNGLGISSADRAMQRKYYEQALTLSLAIGDRLGQSIFYNNLALTYWSLGLYGRGRDLALQAVGIVREAGFPDAVATYLESVARCYHDLGQYVQAKAAFDEALRITQETGNRYALPACYIGLGRLSLEQGDHEPALRWLDLARGEAHELGDPSMEAIALAKLGAACLALEDLQGASERVSQAVALLEKAEGLSGEYPLQEVWWQRYLVERAKGNETDQDQAFTSVKTAREVLLANIAELSDEGLRRNYLNKVRVNRDISLEWARVSAEHRLQEEAPAARAGNLQDQLRRVMETSVRMNEQRDPDALLNFILDEAVELNGAERILLMLVDGDGQDSTTLSRGNALEGESARLTELEQTVAESRRGAVKTSASGKPLTDGPALQVSALAVPLVTGGKFIGLIHAENREVFGAFDQTDLDLLSLFANQAATAIENARLYQGLEQRVQERTAQLESSNRSL